MVDPDGRLKPEGEQGAEPGDWHGGFNPIEHKVGIQCTPLTTHIVDGSGNAGTVSFENSSISAFVSNPNWGYSQ
jgi:hypothetical protein